MKKRSILMDKDILKDKDLKSLSGLSLKNVKVCATNKGKTI